MYTYDKYYITIHYLYFSDCSGGHAEYRVADADGIEQNSMFISSFCSVRISAEWTDADGNLCKKVVWQNHMANSPYSHSPLRMKYCPESRGKYPY